jgi:hypothetical protein
MNERIDGLVRVNLSKVEARKVEFCSEMDFFQGVLIIVFCLI